MVLFRTLPVHPLFAHLMFLRIKVRRMLNARGLGCLLVLVFLVILLGRINVYFPIFPTKRNIDNEPKAKTVKSALEVFEVSTAGIHITDKRDKPRKVVFLKTHKTGSSTITNIIQRYGYSRNLNFALPNKKRGEMRYNYIGDIGQSVREDNLYRLPPNKSYDVLCNHVIYNRKSFRKIFADDTFYFTVLRNPRDEFMSAIHYYGLADGYVNRFLSRNVTNPLSDYLSHPGHFEPKNVYLSFTNNRQLIDLGYPADGSPRNISLVGQYVRRLTKDFDLVMIMEYFDESLILLKRYLNLTFKDIIYIPLNKRINVKRKFILKDTDTENFENWMAGDLHLYKTFQEIFLSKVKSEENLELETRDFKSITKEVQTFCRENPDGKSFHIESSSWSPAFNVSREDCSMIKLTELGFLDKLYAKMGHT